MRWVMRVKVLASTRLLESASKALNLFLEDDPTAKYRDTHFGDL